MDLLQGRSVKYPLNPLKLVVWALVGNEDDGYIGDKNWNPTQEDTWKIRLKWWARNPLHNLTFYVPPFGWASFDRYYKRWEFSAGSSHSFLFQLSVPKVLPIIPLPFIGYTGFFKFYIGWRDRGNFGLKLRGNSDKIK